MSKKATKRMMEEFGAGGAKGLEKLNLLMDKRSLKRNQFKKLFEYVSGIEQYKRATHIDNISKIIPDYPKPEILEIFINEFKMFQDMPESCKKQIFTACVPMSFELQERILKIDTEMEGKSIHGSKDQLEDEIGMYLICNGEVIILKSEKMYEKFNLNEDSLAKDNKFKSTIHETIQFGSVAKIGWAITTYLMNTPQFRKIIDEKIEINKRDQLMKTFQSKTDQEKVHTTLRKGEMFGDFSLIKQRKYQPIYAISMHPDTQVLFLSKNKLREILNVDPVNFKMIKSKIPEMSSNSLIIQKKICRCFEEVEFYPGQKIVNQGDIPDSVYLIKEGTCIIQQSMIEESPTKSNGNHKRNLTTPDRPKRINKSPQPDNDLHMVSPKAQIAQAAGAETPKRRHATHAKPTSRQQQSRTESRTSGARLELPIMEITQNEWFGEEFLLTEKTLNRHSNIEEGKQLQTIVARTYVRALRISCLDFRKKIPKEYRNQLKTLTESKQEYLQKRLTEVTTAYHELQKMETDVRSSYQSKSPAIRQLHPYIPEKIVNSIGFGNGKTRKRHHSRCHDSIRVGEIAIQDDRELIAANKLKPKQIYKIFEAADIKKIENFEVNLMEQRKREMDNDEKSGSLSYVQREVEALQKQLWDHDFRQIQKEKVSRQFIPTKSRSPSPEVKPTSAASEYDKIHQRPCLILNKKEKLHILIQNLTKDCKKRKPQSQDNSNNSPIDQQQCDQSPQLSPKNQPQIQILGQDVADADQPNAETEKANPFKPSHSSQKDEPASPAQNMNYESMPLKNFKSLKKDMKLPVASLLQKKQSSDRGNNGSDVKSANSSRYASNRSPNLIKSIEEQLVQKANNDYFNVNLMMNAVTNKQRGFAKHKNSPSPRNQESSKSPTLFLDNSLLADSPARQIVSSPEANQLLNFQNVKYLDKPIRQRPSQLAKIGNSRNESPRSGTGSVGVSMARSGYTEDTKLQGISKDKEMTLEILAQQKLYEQQFQQYMSIPPHPFRLDVNISNLSKGNDVNPETSPNNKNAALMQINEVPDTCRLDQQYDKDAPPIKFDKQHQNHQQFKISIQASSSPTQQIKNVSFDQNQLPSTQMDEIVTVNKGEGAQVSQPSLGSTQELLKSQRNVSSQRYSMPSEIMHMQLQQMSQEPWNNSSQNRLSMLDKNDRDSIIEQKKSPVLPKIDNKGSDSDLSPTERDMRQIDAFFNRDLNQQDVRLSRYHRKQYQQYLKKFCSKPTSYSFNVTQNLFDQSYQAKELNKQRKLEVQRQQKVGFDEHFDPLRTNNRFQTRFSRMLQSTQRYVDNGFPGIQKSTDFAGSTMRKSIDARATSRTKRGFSMTASSLFSKEGASVRLVKVNPQRKLVILGDDDKTIGMNQTQNRYQSVNPMRYSSLSNPNPFKDGLKGSPQHQELTRRSGEYDTLSDQQNKKMLKQVPASQGPTPMKFYTNSGRGSMTQAQSVKTDRYHEGADGYDDSADHSSVGRTRQQSESRQNTATKSRQFALSQRYRNLNHQAYQTQILINKMSNFKQRKTQELQPLATPKGNAKMEIFNKTIHGGLSPLLPQERKNVSTDRIESLVTTLNRAARRELRHQFVGMDQKGALNSGRMNYIEPHGGNPASGLMQNRGSHLATLSEQTIRTKINSVNTTPKEGSRPDRQNPSVQQSLAQTMNRFAAAADNSVKNQQSPKYAYDPEEDHKDYGKFTQKLKKMRQKRTQQFNQKAIQL